MIVITDVLNLLMKGVGEADFGSGMCTRLTF